MRKIADEAQRDRRENILHVTAKDREVDSWIQSTRQSNPDCIVIRIDLTDAERASACKPDDDPDLYPDVPDGILVIVCDRLCWRLDSMVLVVFLCSVLLVIVAVIFRIRLCNSSAWRSC